ncbi:MAG: BON domain-containing protein [Vicinamibacterales bacterium]
MRHLPALSVLLAAVIMAGCSTHPPKSPDVQADVRSALDNRGLKDISIGQDRDKGVITLSGKVPTEAQKTEAASIAQSLAQGQVVANQLMVSPPGMEQDAAAIHDALDDGIDSNLKAMMIRLGSPDDVSYSVKSAVVTLTGTVASQDRRTALAKAATEVANVKQVVNELQVRRQKATTRSK